MSISTGGISSSLFCSGSSDALIGQHDVPEAWKKELNRKLLLTDDTGSEYLDKYVPSTAPYTFTAATGNEFDNYKPVKGGEVGSYPSFIAGLDALLASFPAEKRVSFFDCHTTMQCFPYSAFAASHHASYPDIAVSFPGRILDAETSPLDWSNFSMIIELNPSAEDDPFRNSGLKGCKTLVQLVINGRNLLHAHSFLASFVIGVYGDIFRISRFDHSGAVFSKALSLRNVDDLQVLQQFFWRFANPAEGNSVLGCDPTVRRLTPDDEEWLKNRLELVGVVVEDVVLSEARRADILDEDCLTTNDPPPAYVLLKALDVNGRLFSRATTVWLGIRDTRRLVNGRLIDLPVEDIPPEDLKMRIIKDAWRQLVRRPEKDYYTRLSRIPSDERVGLPSLICGGDLGEHEARRWESHLYGAPTWRKLINHQARLSTPPTVTRSSSSSIPPPSLFTVPPGPRLPAHRPLQQTFAWRQARGPEHWHRERSHMRFVVDRVGRPLNQFTNTREMAIAVRDAIRGHRVAMTRGGILHRDISVNNILIVDDPDDQAFFGGFIHDFDYSSMSRKAPASSPASLSVAALTELLVGDDHGGELKEKAGTFYFMATMLLSHERNIHGVQHDLESFYWVLLWNVLRYTEHNHPDGQNACPNIFKLGSEVSFGSKIMWLTGKTRKKLSVKNNLPLTILLKEFGDLCIQKVVPHGDPLGYDQVLAIFDKVLDSDQYKALWPEDDSPLEYSLPDTRIQDRKRGKRKRKARKARVPDPDSETDMDDESSDFEFYEDIGKVDGPVPVMPPYEDPLANVLVPSEYAHLFETQPSSGSAPPVPQTPRGDVSFIEACEVEAVLDFCESDDSADEAEDGPDSSPIQKAKKRRRTVLN